MGKELEHRVEAMEQALCEVRNAVKQLAEKGDNNHPWQYTPDVIRTVSNLDGIFDKWHEERYDD